MNLIIIVRWDLWRYVCKYSGWFYVWVLIFLCKKIKNVYKYWDKWLIDLVGVWIKLIKDKKRSCEWSVWVICEKDEKVMYVWFLW